MEVAVKSEKTVVHIGIIIGGVIYEGIRGH